MTPDEARRHVFDRHQLKTQRHRTGLSAAGLAEACGVAKVNVLNWENGRAKPNIDRLPLVVAVLGLNRIDDLFRPVDQQREYEDPDQCAAKTKGSGFTERCRQQALRDSFWCAMHAAPHTRRAENGAE